MFPFPSVRFMTGLALGAAAGYAVGRIFEAKAQGVPLDVAVKNFIARPLSAVGLNVMPMPPGRQVPVALPMTVEYLSPDGVPVSPGYTRVR